MLDPQIICYHVCFNTTTISAPISSTIHRNIIKRSRALIVEFLLCISPSFDHFTPNSIYMITNITRHLPPTLFKSGHNLSTVHFWAIMVHIEDFWVYFHKAIMPMLIIIALILLQFVQQHDARKVPLPSIIQHQCDTQTRKVSHLLLWCPICL